MSNNSPEYMLDAAAFEAWQRDQYTTESDDPERFTRLVKKVIQNELDESEKELVRLYHYERHTLREIAGLIGSSPSTVCRRLDKIHRKMYTYLKYAAELHFGRGM
jgi:RNA polymerase sigma factor (sigma-70 family)